MTPQEISNEIMSEMEQEKLLTFKEDTVMFGAVKKYLLVYLYEHGVAQPDKEHKGNVNWALSLAFNSIAPASAGGVPRSNEELGADLRAVAKGVQVIESGFAELSQLTRAEKPTEPEANPAE